MSLTIVTHTGPLKLQLYCDSHNASKLKHVENFLVHCAKGTYDGVSILRYIPDFIVQTGDKSNTGKQSPPANPDHAFTAIHQPSIAQPPVRRGSVFAVNSPASPDGLGSQFFIVLSEAHRESIATGSYTYLGEIIDGLESLAALENDDQLTAGKNGKVKGRWKTQPWIQCIQVHYNPFAIASTKS